MITSRLTISPGLLCSAGLAFSLLTLPASAQEPAPAPDADGQADPFDVQEDDYFLLREPETAEEFFKGAVQARQLGRFNLSRQYLRRFLELNPDDDTLLKLRDEYGPAVFAGLANQPELQPLGGQVNQRVSEVFRERGASPERITSLFEALGGSPNEAYAARESLVNAGDVVIPAIVERLASEPSDSVRQQLVDVLVAMGETALSAMHAAIDTPDESLRVQVLAVIGRIGSEQSIPHLYFAAFGPDQPTGVQSNARRSLESVVKLSRASVERADPVDVAGQLRREAMDAINAPPPPVDPAATPTEGVRVWSWDDAAGTVRSEVLAPQEASLWQGLRYAREAFLVAPERPETQALYLAILLEREARHAGVAEPPAGPGTAFNLALASGPQTARDVLSVAMDAGLPRAAVGALSVISRTASPSTLLSGDTQIFDALNANDPRVQLAAAVAILRLNPPRAFPQSGRVVEILSRALTANGEPTAVVIDPSVQRGSTLAGFLREMGYEATLAASGQEGFIAATERSQPAFVLVNLNVSRWPLSQTLANFRADARTQGIPVIVVGPAERERRVRTIDSTSYTYFRGPGLVDPRAQATEYLSEIPETAYVVETSTTAAFGAQLRPVLAALSADPLSAREQSEARALAAFWLAQIADTGRKDRFLLAPAEQALIAALSDPTLSENAQIALAEIPTKSAQAALARAVVAPASVGDLQLSAADLLSAHVQRNGVLVPDSTVAELNRLWESTQDPNLRTALAQWGGTLQPGRTITRQWLEQVPAPTLPAPANP